MAAQKVIQSLDSRMDNVFIESVKWSSKLYDLFNCCNAKKKYLLIMETKAPIFLQKTYHSCF